jgi:multidrug/hemolysin transport system ATP-binding protein
MEKIIRVSNLTKKYGELEAVKGITFNVNRGELFAFLGTNGAGKSTTINILTTMIEKSSGEIFIDNLRLGEDDFKIKQLIGVVFQNTTLDAFLTVYENLNVRGCLYPLTKSQLQSRIKAVSEITGCDRYLSQKYGQLSGGQKRKVDIASVLIHEPKILFLDEPTTGLDPSTRVSIWETISEMQKSLKTTVFLTTHYMEEAAKADDIVIVNNGVIVAQGSPLDLRDKYTSDLIKIYNPNEKLIKLLEDNKIEFSSENRTVFIKFSNSLEAIGLLDRFSDLIDSFEVVHGNMDDVFINIVESLKG